MLRAREDNRFLLASACAHLASSRGYSRRGLIRGRKGIPGQSRPYGRRKRPERSKSPRLYLVQEAARRKRASKKKVLLVVSQRGRTPSSHFAVARMRRAREYLLSCSSSSTISPLSSPSVVSLLLLLLLLLRSLKPLRGSRNIPPHHSADLCASPRLFYSDPAHAVRHSALRKTKQLIPVSPRPR